MCESGKVLPNEYRVATSIISDIKKTKTSKGIAYYKDNFVLFLCICPFFTFAAKNYPNDDYINFSRVVSLFIYSSR